MLTGWYYARHAMLDFTMPGLVVGQLSMLGGASNAAYGFAEELARFARGLQDDLIAIQAGLTLEWSNGTVAGRITRLKLLKRHGYGHAGL